MRSAQPREKLTKADWLCVLYLVILIPVMAISLLTNQEIFNAYLVWGDQQFNLQFMQYTMPSSWLITLDATLSFSMLVAVAAFWKWWSLKRPEPDEISKMIIGSLFTIAGGACLFIAAATQTAGAQDRPVLAVHVPPAQQHRLCPHPADQPGAVLQDRAASRSTRPRSGSIIWPSSSPTQMVGYVGGLYSSLPTTTFWLIHIASAAFGLVAFVVFKLVLGKRMSGTGVREQAEALS